MIHSVHLIRGLVFNLCVSLGYEDEDELERCPRLQTGGVSLQGAIPHLFFMKYGDEICVCVMM